MEYKDQLEEGFSEYHMRIDLTPNNIYILYTYLRYGVLIEFNYRRVYACFQRFIMVYFSPHDG